MALDKFLFFPYGDVKITYAWGSKETEYESGYKKYKRVRIASKKKYSFTVSGLTKDMERLIRFYNDHQGQYKPFLFEYDGIEEVCYFSDVLNITRLYECATPVGFKCEVGLSVKKQKTKYGAPLETNMLPAPYGEIKHSIDHNVQVLEMGAEGRRIKSTYPHEKLSCNWSGLKKDRDRIINLFNSHCRIPLLMKKGSKVYKVILPDSLEITDRREQQRIVGYKTSMDLEVVNDKEHR
jgi:hypothetical protein